MFSKYTANLALRHGCFAVNLLHIFQNTCLQEHLWRTASDEKHYKRRYSHTTYFLIEIYDCVHTIFIFQHEKQNKKYILKPFILCVYCLKWTIKRSNFLRWIKICRFKYNFDWLERDKSKFDWRKYKIQLGEYINLPDCEYIRHHWSNFRCWKTCSKPRK